MSRVEQSRASGTHTSTLVQESSSGGGLLDEFSSHSERITKSAHTLMEMSAGDDAEKKFKVNLTHSLWFCVIVQVSHPIRVVVVIATPTGGGQLNSSKFVVVLLCVVERNVREGDLIIYIFSANI